MQQEDRSVGCVLARTQKSCGLRVGASTHFTCSQQGCGLRVGASTHPTCFQAHPDPWKWTCRLAVWLAAALPAVAVAQMPPSRVIVAPVEQRELATGQTFVGTVMPARSSTVGSSVEGLVIELKVDEGDQVEKGATLAQLRTKQLRIQLDAAKAELNVRTQALEELKISLPEQIEQAEARMLASKALMEFAERRLKRKQKLSAEAVTEDDLQESESVALAAEEKYRENLTALQEATVVRPVKLKQASAQLEAQEMEVARLEDEIAQHQIVAPFAGYVTREHTEVGQWIAKGDPVVDVVEVGSVDVEVPVPEGFISPLRTETVARVTIGALPGEAWEAPVTAIVPQADVRSRSFPVKVRLKNRSGPGGVLLKPGMFARVTLPIGSKQPVLLVPKDAVVLGGASPVVYKVAPLPPAMPGMVGPPSGAGAPGAPPQGPPPDGVAQRVPVDLGAAVDGLIEVRGPLKAGDRVVVEGNERLFPGGPLIIIERNRASSAPQKAAAKPSP